jgi:hypothetical protein
MGELVHFPRRAPPELGPDDVTEDELARFTRMRQRGFTEQQAIEVLALRRWSMRGVCHGD